MTFMDQMNNDIERKCLYATDNLLFWLGTIAPLENATACKVKDALIEMAKEMEWPIIHDEYIGMRIDIGSKG